MSDLTALSGSGTDLAVIVNRIGSGARAKDNMIKWGLHVIMWQFKGCHRKCEDRGYGSSFASPAGLYSALMLVVAASANFRSAHGGCKASLTSVCKPTAAAIIGLLLYLLKVLLAQ